MVYLNALHRVSAPEYWLTIITLNSYSCKLSIISCPDGANKGQDIIAKDLRYYTEIRQLYSNKDKYLFKVKISKGRISAED